MPEALGGNASETTRDLWLGERLSLLQPRHGHRVGADAALLAAAAGAWGGRIVDAGAGVGAVGLALLAQQVDATASLVEIDADLAALASQNALQNRLVDRCCVVCADLCDAAARRSAGLSDGAADLVATNPPYHDAATVRASPKPSRARAHIVANDAKGGDGLVAWIRACLALLAPSGRLVMIHRPAALPTILHAMEQRLGAVALLPVYPRAAIAAHRLLVTGVKGSRAPVRVAPPLVLHEAGGALTPLADAVHRGQALISWGD